MWEPTMAPKRLKRLAIALAALSLLVVIAAVVIPKLVDLNRYRDLIASKIAQDPIKAKTVHHIC